MPGVDGVSEEEIMNMKRVLVALLLLLHLNKELLIRTPDTNTEFERVHQYLTPKHSDKLKRAVSQTQFDALLYCTGIIGMNKGKEALQIKKFTQVINTITKCEVIFDVKSEKRGLFSEKVYILTITEKGSYAADESIYQSARSMLDKAARIYSGRKSSTEVSSERRSKRRRLVSPSPAAPSPNANAGPSSPAPPPPNANAAPFGGELLYDSDTSNDVDVDEPADEILTKLQEAEELDFSVQERCLPNGMPVTNCNLSYDSQQIQSEITLTCFAYFGYDLNLPTNEKDRIVSAAKRLVGYRNGLDEPRQIKSYRNLREKVDGNFLFVTGAKSLKAAPMFAKKERKKKKKNKIERIMETDNEILFKAYRQCTRDIWLKDRIHELPST